MQFLFSRAKPILSLLYHFVVYHLNISRDEVKKDHTVNKTTWVTL